MKSSAISYAIWTNFILFATCFNLFSLHFHVFSVLVYFLFLIYLFIVFKVMDKNVGRKVGMIWEKLREEISDQNTLYRKKSIKNGAQGRQDGLVG